MYEFVAMESSKRTEHRLMVIFHGITRRPVEAMDKGREQVSAKGQASKCDDVVALNQNIFPCFLSSREKSNECYTHLKGDANWSR